MKKRRTVRSLSIDTNVRCLRINPVERSKKQMIADLKTVGITLTKQQAIQLARVLLAASQEWDTIDITGYRFSKRASDGTYQITVTSMV